MDASLSFSPTIMYSILRMRVNHVDLNWCAQAHACLAYLLPGCSLVMDVAQLA